MTEVVVERTVQMIFEGRFYAIPEALACKLIADDSIRCINQKWEVYTLTKKGKNIIKQKQ